MSGVVLDASDVCRRDLRDPFSKPGISVDQLKENGNTAKGYLVKLHINILLLLSRSGVIGITYLSRDLTWLHD